MNFTKILPSQELRPFVQFLETACCSGDFC